MNKFCLLVGLALCSGCAHPLTSQLNIGRALTNVFSDLKDTGAVSMTAIDAWTADKNGTFDIEAHDAQCLSRMADPIVAVIPREVIMGIRQAFQSNGQMAAGGFIWPIPDIAITGQAGVSSTQTLSVPIRFTFLSNVPNLRHMIDDKLEIAERDRLMALQADVDHHIKDFDLHNCK